MYYDISAYIFIYMFRIIVFKYEERLTGVLKVYYDDFVYVFICLQLVFQYAEHLTGVLKVYYDDSIYV